MGQKDFAKAFEPYVDERIRAQRVSVLIMGPSIGSNTSSAALRRELVVRCSSEGTSVVAEHDDIVRVARNKLKAGYNLTVYEALVADLSDVVVIIPDSPGSFAELGYFGSVARVCSKMLIFFDKQYRALNNKSYILEGPGKAAKSHSAEVYFVHYSEFEGIWKKVLRKIQMKRATKILEGLRK